MVKLIAAFRFSALSVHGAQHIRYLLCVLAVSACS